MSKNGLQLASDLKYYLDYSRWIEKENRTETWDDSVDRVMNMHRQKYVQFLTNPRFKELFERAESAYKEKLVLGSQRSLQFGGEPILKHNARLYNCFDVNTEFITSEGVRKFSDFNDGDIITVLTHTGKWQKAVVRNYGKQHLNRVVVKRGRYVEKEILVTGNHRWLLKNGEQTTELGVGDKLLSSKDIFSEFNYDSANPIEKLYWCYGYVFGNGTKVKYNGEYTYSMVRLCGSDVKFKERFEEMGFKTSSSTSLDGDFIAYTGRYLKTYPNPRIDSPELIKAFVRGYLDADGTKNSFDYITSYNEDNQKFIEECFPIAGIHIVSKNDVFYEQTNLGKADRAKVYRLISRFDRENKYSHSFKVESIEENVKYDDVWCLEVENDKSFVLEGGLTTGNCTATYVDRIRSFQEIMYLLLCGCGVGFSVQYRHIYKLPAINKRTKGTKTFVVPDSIEGWSDAFGILISSYVDSVDETPFPEYQGYDIRFDLSLIRPEGAMISGGFKAPGPEGLRKSLLKCEELIERNLNQGVGLIRPIMAYDFIMYMADAVLSGGVRRSATICLFSPEDDEMMNAKVGNWFYENPQRARSNNSAVINRNTTSREMFNKIFKSIKDFGEPGFYFVDDEDQVTNPCVTKDTTVMTNEGVFTVEDLIGVKKTIVVNGEEHEMMSNGFWKTGERDIYKLTTNKGYTLRLTENHKVLTVNNLNVETWKELKDISIGDKVKLTKNIGYTWGSQDEGEFQKGWLLGNLIGDGTFDDKSALLRYWGESDVKTVAKEYLNNNFKTYQEFSSEENNDGIVTISSVKLKEYVEQFGVKNNHKLPNKKLEQQSSKFYEGFISGLIDADGTIINDTIKGNYNIRLNQSNIELLNMVQRMLLRLGITSTIYKNRRKDGFRLLPDGNGGLKEYYCKSNHDLQISKSNVIEFNNRVKLNSKKQSLVVEMLENYKPYSEYFNDTVSSIEYDGFEDVYDVNVHDIHRFDANGIIAHNCVEIGLYPQMDGLSGFQGCNLTEGNGGMCTTVEKFYDACESLAVLGTLQAGYTDFPYLGKTTEDIFRRESLLGCSFTGWMANPHIMMDPEIQRKGAELIKKINQELSEIIGINPASRTTCVKPSGNASVLLKSPSGCHGDHAPRYFRVMQINKQSEIGKYLNEEHPYLIEESVWSANKTDYVSYIPIVANKNAKFKKDLVGLNQLEVVKTIQNNWVEYGTNHQRNVQPYLRHSVSNTVELDYSDYDMVEEYLFENRFDFAAVSFLPLTGDKDFNQAPFTSVLSGEELYQKYDDAAFFASGLIVDGLHAFDGNLWEACDYVSKRDLKLQGTRVEALIKKDWIRRAKQFAKRFFKGDTKEMVLCLKDVHLYHKWVRINRELKQRDFDFDTAIKQPEYVNMDTMGAASCYGGACDINPEMLEKMKNN